MEAAVGGLEQMVRQWKHAQKSEQDILKPQCLEFANQIIGRWPERPFASGYYAVYDTGAYDRDEEDEDFDDEDGDYSNLDQEDASQEDRVAGQVSPSSLLSLLQDLGDVSLIAAWIRRVLTKDVSIDPGKTLGDLCKQHGWATFQDDLLELFESTSNETLERHARLLADWSLRKDKDAERRKLCSESAQRIMAAVERSDLKGGRRDLRAWVVNRNRLLPPLMQTFLILDEPKLIERLVTYVLERQREFDLTTVQIPVLLGLEPWLKGNVKHASSAVRRWLSAVLEELEFRASHPPQEPTDWRRKPATGCDCADCKELSRFLEDPNTKVQRFPMAERRRQHLHQAIDQQKLDTTHVTERIGRPYTLVCTKTKASYERALKAHHVDRDHLAKIRKLIEWHEGLQASPDRPKSQRKTTTEKGKP